MAFGHMQIKSFLSNSWQLFKVIALPFIVSSKEKQLYSSLIICNLIIFIVRHDFNEVSH